MRNKSMITTNVVAPTLLAFSLAGLGACATKTRTGAAVGGVSGAVLGAGAGAAAGGNRGAVIGAGVGAVAGAGAGALVGRYMDKQQAALEKQVKGAEIVRQGDEIVVRFDDAILFDLNKADLKPSAREDLTELARVLKQYNETELVIEGHTDSTGPKTVNEKLSWARAQAVLDYLNTQGVDKSRLSARGLADTRPVASNADAAGRQQNRRVQIQIAANEELKERSMAAEQQKQPASGKVPARATTTQPR